MKRAVRTSIRSSLFQTNRVPRPRPLPALLPTALFLFACSTSSTGPDVLETQAKLIGDYTVSADTLIVQYPIDTSWGCTSSGPGQASMTIIKPEPDTTHFQVSGNRLQILRTEYLGAPSDPAYPVIRWRSVWQRVAGGPGLEGRWRNQDYGYEVVSGSLESWLKQRFDRMVWADSVEKRFVTSELEFSRDSMWLRQDGDFAGFFVAEWNGELGEDLPDSARFDVEVKAVDSRTVRFRGRKTGETVTLTLIGPELVKHYSSDNPDHPAFYPMEAFKRCDFGWVEEFLAANQHPAVPMKRSRPEPLILRQMLEKSTKRPFSEVFQGFPLNQPQSLLN